MVTTILEYLTLGFVSLGVLAISSGVVFWLRHDFRKSLAFMIASLVLGLSVCGLRVAAASMHRDTLAEELGLEGVHRELLRFSDPESQVVFKDLVSSRLCVLEDEVLRLYHIEECTGLTHQAYENAVQARSAVQKKFDSLLASAEYFGYEYEPPKKKKN
jgi:hypothetical protein